MVVGLVRLGNKLHTETDGGVDFLIARNTFPFFLHLEPTCGQGLGFKKKKK